MLQGASLCAYPHCKRAAPHDMLWKEIQSHVWDCIPFFALPCAVKGQCWVHWGILPWTVDSSTLLFHWHQWRFGFQSDPVISLLVVDHPLYELTLICAYCCLPAGTALEWIQGVIQWQFLLAQWSLNSTGSLHTENCRGLLILMGGISCFSIQNSICITSYTLHRLCISS